MRGGIKRACKGKITNIIGVLVCGVALYCHIAFKDVSWLDTGLGLTIGCVLIFGMTDKMINKFFGKE